MGALGVILGLALVLETCVSRDEVARVVSPDGKMIARVVEVNAGATTDFLYTIHLRRNWPVPLWDYQVADLYGAVRSDCAYGVNLRWQDHQTLVLEYLEAKEASFDRSVDVLGQTVKILPEAGVQDSAAPCGGMLYNQRGH